MQFQSFSDSMKIIRKFIRFMQETTIISQWNFEIRKGKWVTIYILGHLFVSVPTIFGFQNCPDRGAFLFFILLIISLKVYPSCKNIKQVFFSFFFYFYKFKSQYDYACSSSNLKTNVQYKKRGRYILSVEKCNVIIFIISNKIGHKLYVTASFH